MNEHQRILRDSLLDMETQQQMLVDWVKLDGERRHANKSIVQWTTELPFIKSEMFINDTGQIGVICDYSIKKIDNLYYRCLWVKVPGDFMKVTENECKEVSEEHIKLRDAEFKQKLIAAGKKVERQRKQRRNETVKGSHLLDNMIEASEQYTVDKKSSFYKITGTTKGRAVYVSVKGGRVDLNGFTVVSASVKTVTEEEAKKRHLGRVRGQMIFDKEDSVIMASFSLLLKELNNE